MYEVFDPPEILIPADDLSPDPTSVAPLRPDTTPRQPDPRPSVARPADVMAAPTPDATIGINAVELPAESSSEGWFHVKQDQGLVSSSIQASKGFDSKPWAETQLNEPAASSDGIEDSAGTASQPIISPMVGSGWIRTQPANLAVQAPLLPQPGDSRPNSATGQEAGPSQNFRQNFFRPNLQGNQQSGNAPAQDPAARPAAAHPEPEPHSGQDPIPGEFREESPSDTTDAPHPAQGEAPSGGPNQFGQAGGEATPVDPGQNDQGSSGGQIADQAIDNGFGRLFPGLETARQQQTVPLPSPQAAPPLPLTAGGAAFNAQPGSFEVAPGTTVREGAPAVDINGTPVRLQDSSVYIGGSAIALPMAAPAVTNVGGQAVEVLDPTTAVDVDGTRLSVGGPGATFGDGRRVTLAPSGNLVIDPGQGRGSGGIDPREGALPTQFTVGGISFNAAPAGFAIHGTPIQPGSPAVTFAGTPISLSPSGSLQLGNRRIALAAPPNESVFSAGSDTFIADPTGFDIAGTRVLPGATGLTIAGTPISLSPSGALYVGDQRVPLETNSPQSIFTVGTDTFTANPTGFDINGASISPGGPPIIAAGTPISLGSSGSLVIGGDTIKLPDSSSTHSIRSVFTINDQVFTAAPTGFDVNGTFVSPSAPAITFQGTPISLGPSGILRIGGSTFDVDATETGPGVPRPRRSSLSPGVSPYINAAPRRISSGLSRALVATCLIMMFTYV